ncbi:hypothetical protein [Streptomyces poonensis]|uniref:Uncharacterized protein n=1 Tax=Streptomyces poonensis TaxID=68255 RepID=A0A918PKB2_9ACTN|nr:hypothetical protein [Streptomyces poonensis]GGZ12630.1 hypothetical protein GCM10010365_35380 [Streptomyces poonensis]GLJ92007.1 hypothetical protein GCM10017589_46150 [Streptomyces poonensis]
MAHQTGGSGMRDRTAYEDGAPGRDPYDPYHDDPYEKSEREPRDAPRRRGTHDEPRRPYDDRDVDIREGYR